MDRSNLKSQILLGMEEVTEISLAIDAIDFARAIFLDRREVVLPLGVLHVHYAVACEQHSVATIASRHDTVEHIYTSFNGFEDIGRSTHAHKVTRAVGRKDLIDYFNHLVHLLGRFANSESSDGIAFDIHCRNLFGSTATEVWIGTALDNREEALVIAVETIAIGIFCLFIALVASVEPSFGQSKRFLGIFIVGISWRTFIERHHDVSTDDTFNFHDALWREEMLRTIDMAAESTPFLGNLSVFAQREHLKSA